MVKKTIAWSILGAFLPAMVGATARPSDGPVRQWLTGAAVLGTAGALSWAVSEVGSD